MDDEIGMLPEKIGIIWREGWGIWAIIPLFLGAALGIWRWNRASWGTFGGRRGVVSFVLRCLGAALLVFFLLNPRLQYKRSGSSKDSIAFVLDSSRSMAVKDALGKARYIAAHQVVSSLQDKMADDFDIRSYTFDLRVSESLSRGIPQEIYPRGVETNLSEALGYLSSEVRSRNLRAIVLASDGNDTIGGDLRELARDVRVPIYVIGVGQKKNAGEDWRDLGIERIEIPSAVTIGQEVEAKIVIKSEGFEGAGVQATVSKDDRELATINYVLNADPQQIAPLTFTLTERGVHTLDFHLAGLDGDRIERNNKARVSILVTDQAMNVLYMEGTLRWNYKFLKHMLESEQTFKADCFIRTGGARFYQQGVAQVSKRLPSTPEDFSRYNAIILGDFPRSMLPDEQMGYLEKWVRDGKGGLLLIGGAHTLASGDYIGTPIEGMMPAAFKKQVIARNTSPRRIALTAAGTRGLPNLSQAIFEIALPYIFGLGAIKSGAEVWIQGREGTPMPVLLAQRYGLGRTMLLCSDGFWQMGFGQAGTTDQAASAKFWLQVVQWLAQVKDTATGDDAILLYASTDRSYYESGQTVQVNARLNKKEAEIGNAVVSGEVFFDGQPIASVQFPDSKEGEVTRTNWTPPHDGNFCVRLSVRDNTGEREQTNLYFSSGRPFRELERNFLNETILRDLARESGGGYYDLASASNIESAIETSATLTQERVEKDLVDSPTAFAIFCILLSTDWLIRRRGGLV